MWWGSYIHWRLLSLHLCMNSDPANLIFPRGEMLGRKMLIYVTWADCHCQSNTLSFQIKAWVLQMIQILTMLYHSHILLTTTWESYMIEMWRWVKLMGVFRQSSTASWHASGLQEATVHSSGQEEHHKLHWVVVSARILGKRCFSNY